MSVSSVTLARPKSASRSAKKRRIEVGENGSNVGQTRSPRRGMLALGDQRAAIAKALLAVTRGSDWTEGVDRVDGGVLAARGLEELSGKVGGDERWKGAHRRTMSSSSLRRCSGIGASCRNCRKSSSSRSSVGSDASAEYPDGPLELEGSGVSGEEGVAKSSLAGELLCERGGVAVGMSDWDPLPLSTSKNRSPSEVSPIAA